MTNICNLDPLAVDEWPAALSPIAIDMAGQPLNVHGLLANHPALLGAFWSFRQHAVRGGSLGARSAELVILRTAVHMGSWYEWASHVERGLASQLSLTEIERVMHGPGAAAWDEPDTMLLQAVDELEEKRAISPATLAGLATHFGHEQVLDLIAIHGMYVMLGGMLNTWPVDLDPHVQAALPESLSRDGFDAAAGRSNASGR